MDTVNDATQKEKQEYYLADIVADHVINARGLELTQLEAPWLTCASTHTASHDHLQRERAQRNYTGTNGSRVEVLHLIV